MILPCMLHSKEFVQKLQLQIKIPVHNGCVNSICWNDNGKYLLSGSDDQRLSIVHGYDYSVLAYVQTGHRANIFSAKFLPNTGDTNVVSCSGDGIIIYSNLERPETSMHNKFNCHKGTAYEIMTVPNDPNTFLSCGEDRSVRWFDLRTKTSCCKEDCRDDILINFLSPVTSLAVNPLTPYQLAVGCADASVRVFDRRMLSTQATGGSWSGNGFQALMTCFTVPEFTQSRRITSLCYSADGQEMLVSYSSDYIYLFDIRDDLDKKPRMLSKDSSSNGSENYTGMFFGRRPLMKRLRVRGDWSDTGPNARPEAESREQQETSSQANIVRRMTDILTRMFNNSTQNRTQSAASRSSSGSSHASSQSEDGDADGASDSNEEEGDESAVQSQLAKKENEDVNNSDNEDALSSKVSNDEVKSNTDDNRTNLPSTSTSAFEHEKEFPSSKESEPGPSSLNSVHESEAQPGHKKQNVMLAACENSNVSEEKKTLSDTLSLNFENIEQKFKSRRKDLVEKHHSEPMVNLHYSGQSVSSGLITMDVASSSTANERQWFEQSASDLFGLPSSVCPQEQVPEQGNLSSENQEETTATEVQAEQGSSESETETAVQSIMQSGQGFLPVITNIRSLAHTQSLSSSSGNVEATGDEEGEVELMMEVDSWDIDSNDTEPASSPAHGDALSDDDARPTSSHPVGDSLRACDRRSDSFLSSLDDEGSYRYDDINKEESLLTNVTQPRVKKKFTGHRNARTMIKEATFWGDNFIMSGSDCGHIFIWDRHTAELVMLMEADHHVVNCLQPHPFDPILASSGIDYDIKLWAPLREEPFFDVEKANEIIKRNEIMLEETKDTITVPASFMFRMLATLNHFRTRRSYRWSRAAREMRSANADSSTR
ncbi:DDB1- and CUL4-associated factor 6-like isoform X1 [Stegodyphus dumicola]|uniref:DDB1- and CUL4-associated factor 6-like isoform X1 n=1 Tax=Stegodyphus dumicola TaxID=202533 RepID=UPI0015A9896A|nr:DDB1- and CUL4-associated factor 6-like isoform X1 [Stegodyphus dumicola]